MSVAEFTTAPAFLESANPGAKAAVEELSGKLRTATATERAAALEMLHAAYCHHCGSEQPDSWCRCQCWNDD